MSHPATNYSQLTSNDAGLLTLSFVCPFNYEKYVGIFNILKAYTHTGPSGAKVSWKQDTDIVSEDLIEEPRSQNQGCVHQVEKRRSDPSLDTRVTQMKDWLKLKGGK